MKILNILVVEDQEVDYDLLLVKLESAGLKVRADRVQTALEMHQALERSDWDAIICDYWLPGFSGKGALEIFQKDGRDIPFLFYSGHLGEELLVECMRLGAHDFILKGNSRLIPALSRELKDAEQRRQEREDQARYRSIVEDSDDGICCAGPDDRILFVNGRFADLLEIEADWLTGQPLASIGELQPDWLPYLTQPHQNLKSVPAKLTHARQDKSDVSLSVRPLKGSGLVLKVTDLSGPRLLEKRLALASKMEAIGRLAGTVAHDFNNTLSIISGFCDILKEETDDRDQLSLLNTMHQTIRRGTSLCNQMMSVGKINKPNDSGGHEIRLREVLQNYQPILQKAAGAEVEFRILCSAEQDAVRFDGDLLLQVLVNLTLNAKDAIGQLNGAMEPRKILISTQDLLVGEEDGQSHLLKAGAYVVLCVSDNGAGMDEEVRAHVFEPYFTTKGDCGGTGLGLSSVYASVAQYGGNIWVYSEKGNGTSFKIYLPLLEQRSPTILPEIPRCSGEHVVLLVDDCALTREMARAALEEEPYQLLEAGSGREALEQARAFPGKIDLVISDVVMPGMMGPELVDHLRLETPDLSVIFTSGYGRDFCALPNTQQVPHRFVEKPMSATNLIRQTRLALAERA
ncbi:MAG: response regulator [Candidatus Eremiobacteraeota bacterium]|nr:response regulator [Candidatus Eremiobacteraeota bacterium]